MRRIIKGAEPATLTAHRKTEHCDYDNFPDKVGLRKSLIREQQRLCCYCMGRIYDEPTSMKIEHWHCRADHPNEELDYGNLLGACRGGEGQPSHLQHCDTRKGDDELQWNPADPTHHIETRISYQADGTIRSSDAGFDAQLNRILNLNLPVLKNNRKAVLSALLEWWRNERPVPQDKMEGEIARLTDGDELSPYVQIAVWWLQIKINQLAA